MSVTVDRKMTDGLYVATTESLRGHEGSAIWTLRKLRKDTKCVVTGRALLVGESHYGPIGNMDYRGWRVHRECFEGKSPALNQRGDAK